MGFSLTPQYFRFVNAVRVTFFERGLSLMIFSSFLLMKWYWNIYTENQTKLTMKLLEHQININSIRAICFVIFAFVFLLLLFFLAVFFVFFILFLFFVKAYNVDKLRYNLTVTKTYYCYVYVYIMYLIVVTSNVSFISQGIWKLKINAN